MRADFMPRQIYIKRREFQKTALGRHNPRRRGLHFAIDIDWQSRCRSVQPWRARSHLGRVWLRKLPPQECQMVIW